MKRVVCTLFACLVFASISVAQQTDADAPATKADIERYFEVTHQRELLRQTMEAMTAQMHTMLHEQLKKQTSLPPDTEARLDKVMDDVLHELPLDELMAAMEPVFEKHLTKGDVEALVTFYSTTTGQKLLKAMPTMTAEAMQAASGIIQKSMAEANQRVAQELQQMLKANDPNGASAAPVQN
jgi:uncharacterized protein